MVRNAKGEEIAALCNVERNAPSPLIAEIKAFGRAINPRKLGSVKLV